MEWHAVISAIDLCRKSFHWRSSICITPGFSRYSDIFAYWSIRESSFDSRIMRKNSQNCANNINPIYQQQNPCWFHYTMFMYETLFQSVIFLPTKYLCCFLWNRFQPIKNHNLFGPIQNKLEIKSSSLTFNENAHIWAAKS